MSSKMTFKCTSIYPGTASAPALVSDEAICFYLVKPDTGVVIEKGHMLEGKSMEGKVLVAHSQGQFSCSDGGCSRSTPQREGPGSCPEKSGSCFCHGAPGDGDSVGLCVERKLFRQCE